MDKLGPDVVEPLLKRALSDPRAVGLPEGVKVADEVLQGLARMCDGDARAALNGLEIAMHSCIKANTSAGGGALSARPGGGSAGGGAAFNSGGHTDEAGGASPSGAPAATAAPETSVVELTVADVEAAIQRTHLLYDRAGERGHWDCGVPPVLCCAVLC